MIGVGCWMERIKMVDRLKNGKFNIVTLELFLKNISFGLFGSYSGSGGE
jgi:hypothetical protein